MKATNDTSYHGVDSLDVLSQFKNLKQLVFYNMYCTDLIMFRIQEACPQLTELTFNSDYKHFDAVEGSLDQDIGPNLKLNKSFMYLKFSNSSPVQDYFEYSLLDTDSFGGLEGNLVYGLNGPRTLFTSYLGYISTIRSETIDRLDLDINLKISDQNMLFLRYLFKNCINLQYFKLMGYFQIQGLKIRNLIIGYLPNIEVVVLGSRSGCNASLDLTPFKSLKRYFHIIQQPSDYIREALTIKFKYKDGTNQWYHYDDNVDDFFLIKNTTSRPCRSFTCNKELEFNVCFEFGESLSKFDIEKSRDICYRVPTELI
ncbi:hypothetical protein BDF21DRAFT_498292 [Thamnidium elegans]|nr:hypothetical protein BDF21DRAFT_498292 [Thamnidium elegans]